MSQEKKVTRGKKLIMDVFNHKKVEYLPWVPFAGVHAASLKKYTASEIFTDSEKLLEVLLEVNRLYYPDGQPITFDLQIEAEILGCELRWSDKAPPIVVKHPLAKSPQIPTRILMKNDGRLPIILNVMKRFKSEVGDDTALFGLICGPLTLSSHLRGTDFYLDLITNKEYAKELINYCTKVAKKIAEYYMEAGMDIIAVVDPVVSQISPRTFNEFLVDPFKEIFQFIKINNCLSSFFVCGDATKNLELMCDTNPDSIFVDENIDMVVAKKIISEKNIILGGNIPLTTIMLFGTQQDNMKYVIDLIDKIGKEGLIIAPGCDMPYDVPPDNVIGVVQAIKEPELIRESLKNYEKIESDIDIELPKYNNLEKPLIEVFTIDSDVCAACSYMASTAIKAKEFLGDKVDLVEYKFIKRENIARAKKLGLEHLPCILINGKLKYSSIIPSKEELVDEIKKLLRNDW